MRIQHNIMAMNSYRNYTANNSQLSKNLEKLSSGYKINRAGDDAAGLAISEKMRAQITGLETAQSNAQSGINLVQTAEGALTEVHDMLNRMIELADQSANGTYDSTTDRANLQKEFEQLSQEIDRIADASNFNGQALLNGALNEGFEIAGETTVTSALEGEFTVANGVEAGTYTYRAAVEASDAVAGEATGGTLASAERDKLTIGTDVANGTYVWDATGSKWYAQGDEDKTAVTGIDKGEATLADGNTIVVTGHEDAVEAAEAGWYNEGGEKVDGITYSGTAEASNTVTIERGETTEGKALTLQIGDTSDSYNQITVDISDMHVESLEISGTRIDDQIDAAAAVDKIKAAINKVSETRGNLGATQNRLEHTINNLSVMTENVQDAEANIRDVDVAKEMMEYTKNNILVQSAQAMLAQANQVPQGVLQLLQ